MDTKKPDKVMLAIDGNSLINREYYGMPPLSSGGGVPTNAVLGFINKLIRYTGSFSPDYAAAAFDLPEPTFRHLQYPGYKASRKGMPDELAEQLPYVKQACGIFGFSVISEPGYEADDILGTKEKKAEESEENIHTYIITGDKDSFQLVSDKVSVLYNSNAALFEYTPQKIKEQYGLAPPQLIDLKALMGDASDEIPGVSGIGEKGALALIRENGSLEAVYEKLEAGTLQLAPAGRKKLAGGKADALMSRVLAEICRDVPLGFDIFQKRKEPDKTKLYDFCKNLDLFSVIKKLNLSADEQIQFEF
jgi:DNA polymerase-1